MNDNLKGVIEWIKDNPTRWSQGQWVEIFRDGHGRNLYKTDFTNMGEYTLCMAGAAAMLSDEVEYLDGGQNYLYTKDHGRMSIDKWASQYLGIQELALYRSPCDEQSMTSQEIDEFFADLYEEFKL